jgi:signal transduction histidine kinase
VYQSLFLKRGRSKDSVIYVCIAFFKTGRCEERGNELKSIGVLKIDQLVTEVNRREIYNRLLLELILIVFIMFLLIVMTALVLTLRNKTREEKLTADLFLARENQRVALVENARISEQNSLAIQKLNEYLEHLVQERTGELEAKNKELESFSYSVSHDLRAPLRAIQGYTRILSDNFGIELDAEGRQLCRNIENSALRMSVLIDDLLRISRITKTDMSFSVIDMKAMAATVCEGITSVYEEQKKVTQEKESEKDNRSCFSPIAHCHFPLQKTGNGSRPFLFAPCLLLPSPSHSRFGGARRGRRGKNKRNSVLAKLSQVKWDSLSFFLIPSIQLDPLSLK